MTDKRRISRRFKDDIAFYDAQYDELLAQYPEQWIAIFGKTVVAAAPDPDDLIVAIKAKGIPPEHTLIEHLTREEQLLILAGI